MKPLFLSIVLVLSFAAWGFAQVPNGNLENWSGGDPVGWTTNNIPGYVFVSQSTTAQSGSYSAKFAVVDNMGSTASQSLIGPGCLLAGPPTSITFWYQFTSVGADSLLFSAAVWDRFWGYNIGYAEKSDFALVTSWTPITLPFDYVQNPSIADSVNFQFDFWDLNGGSVNFGTFVLLDNFSLDVPTSLDEQSSALLKTSIYPNPANHEMNIGFVSTESGTAKIKLMDSKGRLIASQDQIVTNLGWEVTRMDTQLLSSGFYFVAVEIGAKSAFLKVNIVH